MNNKTEPVVYKYSAIRNNIDSSCILTVKTKQ